MKMFIFSFLVFFTFSFIFVLAQPMVELNQKDSFLLIQVYEKGEFTHEITTTKDLFSVNLNSFEVERIDLYTNNGFVNNFDSLDSGCFMAKFFDFQDGTPPSILKRNILKEIFEREKGNPKDRISVVRLFL